MPSGNCDDHKDIDRQLLNLEALPERLPLVECSPICPCSGNCANRLTQRGVLISTTIRPSSSGVGLGLFYISTTHDDLPQGCFVSLYAGEYLTTDQARQRWSNQRVHEEGQGNHILSLKLPGKTWHIDPRFKGNIGRFLNHSCDPNCVIQIVRWGIDSLPRAAIFTKRGVRVGEELTFDYANASGSVDLAAQLDRQNVIEDGAGRTKCLCGSQKCRGWMPFDETL
nr:uncharacterized protein I206_02793 [Kwoniella pini CBS 10737]OCF50737.1 hypothetical protein I206_02793 [Kwoniella pini CBS 10737]